MNKHIITGCCALFVAAILTSCSTSVEIAKRQHNDGYYIHLAKKNAATPVNEVVAKNEVQPAAAHEVSVERVVLEEQAMAPASNEVVVASNEKHTVSYNKHKEVADPAFIAPEESQAKVTTESNFQKKITPRDVRKAMRGDAPAIVLILLCLFLPFIAVGIVDDWHTKFLFSILLTLLFFIPGVIYAFFVCFG